MPQIPTVTGIPATAVRATATTAIPMTAGATATAIRARTTTTAGTTGTDGSSAGQHGRDVLGHQEGGGRRRAPVVQTPGARPDPRLPQLVVEDAVPVAVV